MKLREEPTCGVSNGSVPLNGFARQANFQKNTLFFSNLAYFVFLVSCSNSSPCGGDVPIKTAQRRKNLYNKKEILMFIFLNLVINLKNNKNKKTKCQNQSGFQRPLCNIKQTFNPSRVVMSNTVAMSHHRAGEWGALV